MNSNAIRRFFFLLILASSLALNFFVYEAYFSSFQSRLDNGGFQMGWGVIVFVEMVLQVILLGLAAVFADKQSPIVLKWLVYFSASIGFLMVFLPT